MAQVIGNVKSFETGTFFVKGSDGQIRQLKAGDLIYEGENVYGAATNGANAKIVIAVMLAGAGDLVIGGNGALTFDTSVLAGMFSHNDAVVYVNSVKEALAAVAPSDAAADEDITDAGETAAGDAVTDTERAGDIFAARTGAVGDVSTGLLDPIGGTIGVEVPDTRSIILETPTEAPTPAPTEAPTPAPTEAPTPAPTEAPTPAPTEAPTPAPTEASTAAPTEAPTPAPTEAPVDKMPLAVEDIDSVEEDSEVAVEGNVFLDNDILGDGTADEHVITWGDDVAQYGTIIKNDDGSYRYSLDSNHEDIQGLDDSDTPLTETFSYTVTDADGDTSTAQLTIKINGTNDAPTLTVGEPGSVEEEALSTGTDPVSEGEYTEGTFTIGDPDGLDDIKTITIGDKEFTIVDGNFAALVGETVDTEHGEVTITSYDEGEFGYTYTLGEADDVGDENDSFVVAVSDGTENVYETVTIAIADDHPMIVSDAQNVVMSVNATDAAVASLGTIVGADRGEGARVVFNVQNGDPVTGVGSDGEDHTLTSDGNPLVYRVNDDGSISAGWDEEGTFNTVFTVTGDAVAGTYTVDRVGTVDPVTVVSGQTPVEATFTIAPPEGGGNVVSHTLSSEDGGIYLTLTGTTDAGVGTINYSVQGMGVSEGASIDEGDTLKMTFTDSYGQLVNVTGLVLETNHLGSAETATWSAVGVASGSFTGVGEGGDAGNASAAADDTVFIMPSPYVSVTGDEKVKGVTAETTEEFISTDPLAAGETFSTFELGASAGSYSIGVGDTVRVTYEPIIVPVDVTLSFEASVYDSDDLVSTEAQPFNITFASGTILSGSDDSDVIVGSSANEILFGGDGEDVLMGVDGDDSLVFDADDTLIDGGTGSDTLILAEEEGIDFSELENNPVINIEVIDLTQNGDHELENISLNNVVEMTDADNDLTILRDTSEDTVEIDDTSLAPDNETPPVSGFDTYVNVETTDPTVTLKIEQVDDEPIA